MAPILSFLFALGSLAGTGVAWYPTEQTTYSNNTLITFQNPGCYDTANGFVYHNFQPKTCAVTITATGLSISEAIAAKKTIVQSGLFIRNESGYAEPTFVAWDEGPDSNSDGLLQCGSARVSQTITGESCCISSPNNDGYHGFSYWRPGQNDDEGNGAQGSYVPACTGEKYPDAVLIKGKIYTIVGIPDNARFALLSLALNVNVGGLLSADLDLDVYLAK